MSKILLICIVWSFVIFTGTSCERLVVHESSNCQLEALNAKLDNILSKLRDLPNQPGACTRLCTDEIRDLQQKFFSAETVTRTSSSSLANSAKSGCTLFKYCQRAGLTDVTLPNGKTTLKLLCDVDHWIIVMQRLDGSVNFPIKNWEAYKNGFGTVGSKSEFFIRLQNLHEITSSAAFELRIELEDFDGVKTAAHYSDFIIGDEQRAYKLYALGSYSGTAGDSFKYHEGQSFTTLDRDNDAKAIGSCGEEFNSAGWFKACMEANLFGSYLHGENNKFKEGMYWETFRGPEYSLKSIKVSLRSKC